MLRTFQVYPLLLLGIVTVVCCTEAGAQRLDPISSQWDSTNQVLFLKSDRGLVSRTYEDGSSQDIDIFRNVAGLQEVGVWGLTAGPDGTALVAAALRIRNQEPRGAVFTYGRAGELLKTWDLPPQSVDAMIYSADDDAVFVLGDRDVPAGANAGESPLVLEYGQDGRLLKKLVPAGKLMNGGESLRGASDVGEPGLRVTRDYIYIYAPKNREIVTCSRSEDIVAVRSINDIVGRLSTEDGYHLEQTHHVDFTGDGDVVLELLLFKDSGKSWMVDVVRVNPKTNEGVSVHKSPSTHPLWFIGVKGQQYLYVDDFRRLYVQTFATQEAVPLTGNLIALARNTD